MFIFILRLGRIFMAVDLNKGKGHAFRKAFLSPALSVKHSTLVGRYVVANRNIQEGETIMFAKPFLTNIKESFRKRVCAYIECLKIEDNGRLIDTCKKCGLVYYCSPRCRELDTKCHSVLCVYIKKIHARKHKLGEATCVLLLALLRVWISNVRNTIRIIDGKETNPPETNVQDDLEIYDASLVVAPVYEDFIQLCSHVEGWTSEKLKRMEKPLTFFLSMLGESYPSKSLDSAQVDNHITTTPETTASPISPSIPTMTPTMMRPKGQLNNKLARLPVSALSSAQQQALHLTIHTAPRAHNTIPTCASGCAPTMSADSFVPSMPPLPTYPELLGWVSRIESNSFAAVCAKNREVGEQLSIGAAMFNHSCQPNAMAEDSDETSMQAIRIVATAAVAAGEELFLSYIPVDLPLSARQPLLQACYNFTCRCVRCVRESENKEKVTYVKSKNNHKVTKLKPKLAYSLPSKLSSHADSIVFTSESKATNEA